MKTEATDNTAADLVSIPSPEVFAPAVPLIIAPNLKWTPQDDMCAMLFGPWNNLPCYDHINEAALLRDLDSAIVLFEARIQHSDVGFRAWRERHKQAMEAGLAHIPGFPCLQIFRDGKRIWKNEAWEQRYHYLVYQRNQIVEGRLFRLLMLPRYARGNFFGECPAPARATLKKRGRGSYSRPLGLKCDWWKPLDFLLERAAGTWRMNVAEVKARFWMDDHSASVKTRSREVAMEDEGSKEPVVEKENIVPLVTAAELPPSLFQPPVSSLLVQGSLGLSF